MNKNSDRIGFIFDLDGTLINSTDVGDIIAQEIYKKFNIQVYDKLEKEIDDLIYSLVQGENRKRLGTKIMLAIFKKIGLSFIQRLKALRLSSKIFKEEAKKIKLFDGAKEVFEFLEKNSYPYAIATTSSSKEVTTRLKKFPKFYSKLEEKIISRSSVKNLKPHPESIEKASQIIGIPFNQLVVIGDLHTDIIMGKNVGAVTIGVLTGMFNQEKMMEYNPDFIFNSVAEIPNNIDKIKEKVFNHRKEIHNKPAKLHGEFETETL